MSNPAVFGKKQADQVLKALYELGTKNRKVWTRECRPAFQQAARICERFGGDKPKTTSYKI